MLPDEILRNGSGSCISFSAAQNTNATQGGV